MPDTIEERLRKLRAQQGGRSIEERLAALRAQQPQPQPGSFTENLKTGAARGVLGLTNPVEAAGNAITGLLTGDTQPLKELGKGVALGAARLYAGSTAGNPGMIASTQAAIEQGAQERQQRRFQQGDVSALDRAAKEKLLSERESKDPSLSGKITRGTVSAAVQSVPYLAAGPGGVPALAATGAAMSLGEPENIPISAGLAATPIPVGQAFKAGVNAVRRAFGKGAAQIVEAEALPAATAQVRQSIGEVPPAAGETSPTVQRAMQQFEEAVQRINASNLTPAQKAQELDAAIRTIGREASGARPAPTSVYPPLMEFPENPNPIQQAGRLPFEAPEPAAIRPAAEALPMQGRQVGRVVTVGDKTYRLTPEQEAQWVAQIDSATVRNKGDAMRLAAVKRQIVAAPTPKEEAAAAAREATNYRGKPVVVDVGGRQVNATVEGMAFGRVKVKLEDGQTVTVPPSSVQSARAAGPTSQAEMSLPKLEADLDAPSVKAAPDLPYTETVGPRINEPTDALNAAVSNAAQSVPAAQRAKDELLGLLGASKSLRSTLDISYPLRQGAILLLRPLQWRQAGRVWKQMFRGFKTKNFEAIKDAIETHPLAGRMDGAGLYRGMVGGEEAFARRAGSKISEVVNKTPGVKHSEQAYTAAADTQRVGAFEQYARVIDKAGLSAEEALKADKAAAQWINITTGRGSLGKRIDRAMEGLNFFFFSPRFVASRLNVLNPLMYARNAASPGGRVVLRQQMADLAQFASVVGTTLYLAKQAGANVTLNPKSADFGKIKVGNWRWDLGAGLSQVMRLYYRIGEDFARAGRGEKPKFGKSAIDIGETFLSYKLSPPAGVFRDFIKQRTVEGKDPTVGHYIENLIVPMQWADFVEAYQKEAWGGVAKTLPGAVGIGVQNYDLGPVDAAIEKSQPLFTELKRLNKRVSELRKKDGEKDDAFNARVQQFGQNYTLYGQKLLDSPRFKAAPDAVKALALDSLNARAKAVTSRELAIPELVLDPNTIMDAAENSKKNPANK